MRLTSLLFFLLAVECVAAPPPTERTVAGLDAEVHAAWTSVPLRDWDQGAAALAGRPVILDRRVDPTQPVTITVRGKPVREVLALVAADAGAAVEELDSTIRLVPAAAAGRATHAEAQRRLHLASLPPKLRRSLAAAEPLSWPAGASPRDLVASLAAAAGLKLEGIDAIPHDHLAAADLPQLSLAERLDLILADVDRRIAWNGENAGAAGRIVAIDAGLSPAALVAATPRQQRGDQPRRTVKVRDEFTLRLEAPLDQALAAIARQLDLELELDRASLTARGIAPGEIVRAEVVKASRDELFDAIVRPLGLEWNVAGRRLRVFATGSPSP